MISGQLTEEDFLAAQRLYRQRCARGAIVILLIVAAAGVALLLTTGQRIGIGLLCIAVGGLLGETIQSRLLLPRQARRLFRQCAAYRQPFQYSWDEDCLSVTCESGNARRRWSDYVKYRENDRVLLLYHADNLFEMLPKAWFSGAEQMAGLRRLAVKAGGGSNAVAPAS